ncbi:hypothetical protein Misp02_49760 [Microtetraspora sp. NBRC 16547]|nr:hypothetical protein Misp02_49760 [Microtetraspora sp. NBRC 16547]
MARSARRQAGGVPALLDDLADLPGVSGAERPQHEPLRGDREVLVKHGFPPDAMFGGDGTGTGLHMTRFGR